MKVQHLIQHLERIEREKPDLDVLIWKPGDHMEPEVPMIMSSKGKYVCFIEVNSIDNVSSSSGRSASPEV